MLPIPVLSPGLPLWAQGVDLWYDYTQPRGSQALGFPPATDTHASSINSQSSFGSYQSFAANVPVRTNLGLQTVPTRTNLITQSGDLTNAAWSALNASAVSSAVASAVSGQTLQLVTSLNGSGNRVTTQGAVASVVNATVYAATFEMQKGSSNFGGIVINGAATKAAATFNLLTGAVVGVSGAAALAGAIRQVGSSYFCTVTFTAAANEQAAVGVGVSDGTTYVSTIFPSASSGTIYASNAQLEAGAFATPPIVTTSSALAVNGNQQVIDLTGRLATGVAGIVQLNQLQPSVAATFPQYLEFNDNTGNNRFFIYFNTSTDSAKAVTGGITSATDFGAVGTGSGVKTIAFAIASGFVAFRQVGAAQNTGTLSSYPTGMDRMGLGGDARSLTNNAFLSTRKLALSFGAQNQTTFNAMFARAQIAAVS